MRRCGCSPNHAEAHHNLGALLLKTERPADAVPHLQDTPRLRPGHAETLANLGRASCMRWIDRSKRRPSCAKPCACAPDHAPTHNSLALVLVVLGQLSRADITCAKPCTRPGPRRMPRATGNAAGRRLSRPKTRRPLTASSPRATTRTANEPDSASGWRRCAMRGVSTPAAARHLRAANVLALAARPDDGHEPAAHRRVLSMSCGPHARRSCSPGPEAWAWTRNCRCSSSACRAPARRCSSRSWRRTRRFTGPASCRSPARRWVGSPPGSDAR